MAGPRPGAVRRLPELDSAARSRENEAGGKRECGSLFQGILRLAISALRSEAVPFHLRLKSQLVNVILNGLSCPKEDTAHAEIRLTLVRKKFKAYNKRWLRELANSLINSLQTFLHNSIERRQADAKVSLPSAIPNALRRRLSSERQTRRTGGMKDIFSPRKNIYLTAIHYSPVLPVALHSTKSTFEVRCAWGQCYIHNQPITASVSTDTSSLYTLTANQKGRFMTWRNAVVWLAEALFKDF